MAGEPIFRERTKRFGLLQLDVEVDASGVAVRLRPLQRSPDRIPVAAIAEARVADYSAPTYHGWHWGLRTTASGNTAYRLRGHRGVELVLTDGRRVFVGSQRPLELQQAVAQVAGPG